MLQKVKSYSQLFIAKKSLKTLLKTNRFESEALMKNYHRILVENNQLHEDLTKGSVEGKNKLSKQLIDSFVELREQRHDEDFYTQVANQWVKK
ncbi:hypothetical protein NSQ77_04345 [Oceanobacillus sp. FSL K6-2867]|uniref:hypothetical protein n=1 Tax=Oceanobacillus sp. FSL K6-2867 TaxID=2954748 RepID=UPI0030DB9BB1